MVIAALLCFVALLIAWLVAPDERSRRTPAEAPRGAEFDVELAPAA